MEAAGVDEDFQRMLDETVAEYKTTTGRDLRENVSLEAENLLANIKEDKVDDEEKQKWKKAKEYLRNSLKCILTLGSIAAQGASMAFGPAQLCFNAASFLIDTAQKYEKIFSGLGDLFEKIYGFLLRFEVHARPKAIGVKIDSHLKLIIHKLLRKFVDICALSVKLASTKGKIRAALSAFAFGSDQGVSAAMASLQFLVEEETRMAIALTLEDTQNSGARTSAGITELKGFARNADTKLDNMSHTVSLTLETTQSSGIEMTSGLKKVNMVLQNTEAKVEALHKAEKRKEEENFIEKTRKKVKELLNIKEETWRDHQNDYLRSAVENTGKWLFEDEQFTAWKATNEADHTNPVFALEAGKGFGKSILCAKVIEHLKDSFKDGNQTDRVSVAFFFFKEDRSSREDNLSMNNALQKIVWQLSKNDPAYQKFVAGVGQGSDSFSSNTMQLWEKGVRDYAKTNATFFIILDGIDIAKEEAVKTQPLVKILQDIAYMTRDPSSRLRIRLFLTGQGKDFSELINKSGTDIYTVALGQVNRDDIVQFINNRLGSAPALHTHDNLRVRICGKLLDIAGGDYLKLTPILEEVSKKDRRNEIEAALERARKDPQEALRRQVEKLNAQLDDQDIKELNELLVWVFFGMRSFLVEEMETVLFLRNSASREDSLVTLARQIEEKYSMLLYIGESSFVMAHPTLWYIKDLQSEQQEAEEDADSEADSTKLHKSEVDIVRRFLKQVCDDKLFAKFGFEDLFKRKMGKKVAKIDFQAPNGHVRILLTSLKAICGDDRDKTKPLHQYFIYSLDYHLNEADLAHAEHKAKQEIGALLLQMFTDEKCIKTWWTDARLNALMRYYVDYQSNLEDAILRWFKDTVVVEHLSEDDKHWINDLLSKSKPEEDLFKYITRVTARVWLQSFKWPLFDYFYWVYAFVTKIENRSRSMKQAPENIELLKIPADMIYAAEKWAKKELAIDESDVQWIVRVAYTLSHFGHQAEALERWRLACSMDPHNWMVDFLHVKIKRDQQDYEACLKRALAIVERFRTDESLRNDIACSWKEVLRTIADAYHSLEQHEASIHASCRLLEQFPDDYKFVMTVVERFDERGNFRGVIALLEELDMPRPIERLEQQNQKERQQNANNNEGKVVEKQEEDNDNENSGPTKLTTLYHAFASSDDYDSSSSFHYRVARAARVTNSMVVVHKAFCNAMDAAKAQPSPSSITTSPSPDEDILAALRYYYALTLLHQSTYQDVDDADADTKKAVELLECNLLPNKLTSPTTINAWTLYCSARALSSIYLHYAKSVGVSGSDSDQWTKKLRTLVDAQSAQASSTGEGGPVATTLVLGRVLHLAGKESEAREATRGYVRVALNLLDDDDPDNDTQAYLMLGEALAPLDDDVNALAAWGVIRPWEVGKKSDGKEGKAEDEAGGEGGDKGEETAEKQKGVERHTEQNDSKNDEADEATADTEPPKIIRTLDADDTGPKSSTDDGKQGIPISPGDGTAATGEEPPPPRLDGPLGNYCDGNCNTTWEYPDDIYVCKDCIDVQFCAVCFDKVRTGTLERQICGRDHAFLHVPRWTDIAAADKAAGGVPKGFMRVGNEVLAIKDWINGIRVKWGFAKVD
ncbi:putative neutral amino acid permease protein [Lasiodiplodia theobromae]|nr:putative neutral amino acid permease protein [Lasiodiplodia theobromae]